MPPIPNDPITIFGRLLFVTLHIPLAYYTYPTLHYLTLPYHIYTHTPCAHVTQEAYTVGASYPKKKAPNLL